MAFHLCAYSDSLDQAVIAPIAAVADPSMSVAGFNIQVPDYAPYLMGAFGIGVNIARAQLQSPSLRRVVNYEIDPIDVDVNPAYATFMNDIMRNPIPLDVAEQMQAYASEVGAGATRMSVLTWLGDGKIDTVTDPIYTVRATAAIATVAYVWNNGALVFDQVLPVGDYAIVGANYFGATAIAFRFVFQGSTPRPGGLGMAAATNLVNLRQRWGNWGVWGIFNSTTPPTVDVFTSGIDASQIFHLDLIKVG